MGFLVIFDGYRGDILMGVRGIFDMCLGDICYVSLRYLMSVLEIFDRCPGEMLTGVPEIFNRCRGNI